MTEVTWGALALALTVVGVIWTWVAFRRRGAANGLRALGFTLLPAAAWLTGTLEMFTEIAGSVTDWATGLVFNPFVWTGIGLAGTSLLLFLVSGILRDRQLARGSKSAQARPVAERRDPQLGAAPTAQPGRPVIDDDLSDVEAILKRRGIE